jgi:mannosyltransferase OCH1-like enzyme
MIPKKLHFVWIGDESKRPENCIQSWAKLNPEYEIVIWGNKALSEYSWVNKKHMDAMYARELNGVADIMRSNLRVVVFSCSRPSHRSRNFTLWRKESALPQQY